MRGNAGDIIASMPPAKPKTVYQYALRFDAQQLDLVSKLMASTGLGLSGVIRLALTRLAKTELPSTDDPAKTTNEGEPAEADPELDGKF